GVNVHPGEVEAELSALPGIAQVCVVGTADPEWGQLVTAVVVPDGGACPRLESLRQAVGSGPHAPRALVTAAELPMRESGKVDRRASAALAEEEVRKGRGVRHGPSAQSGEQPAVGCCESPKNRKCDALLECLGRRSPPPDPACCSGPGPCRHRCGRMGGFG